jgi:uncharacterized protein YciU (UPF0263 family)
VKEKQVECPSCHQRLLEYDYARRYYGCRGCASFFEMVAAGDPLVKLVGSVGWPCVDCGFRHVGWPAYDQCLKCRPGPDADPADIVNHPKHYTRGGIETIDVIEAWELNFHLGNAVKYISRAGHKGDAIEDLRKARWYLDREIARREKDIG